MATTERMGPLAALRAAATFALAYHLPNSAEDFDKAAAAVAELVAKANVIAQRDTHRGVLMLDIEEVLALPAAPTPEPQGC